MGEQWKNLENPHLLLCLAAIWIQLVISWRHQMQTMKEIFRDAQRSLCGPMPHFAEEALDFVPPLGQYLVFLILGTRLFLSLLMLQFATGHS